MCLVHVSNARHLPATGGGCTYCPSAPEPSPSVTSLLPCPRCLVDCARPPGLCWATPWGSSESDAGQNVARAPQGLLRTAEFVAPAFGHSRVSSAPSSVCCVFALDHFFRKMLFAQADSARLPF